MSVELLDRIESSRAYTTGQVRALLYAGAQVAQDVAYAHSRVDTGTMRDSIEIVATGTRALEYVVECAAFYGVYNEYGTGIYATGPGGSRAKSIPWVYFDARTGRFVTTYGMTPHPFMRPGYEAARKWVVENAHRFFPVAA